MYLACRLQTRTEKKTRSKFHASHRQDNLFTESIFGKNTNHYKNLKQQPL